MTFAGTLLGKDPRTLPLPKDEADPFIDDVREAAATAVLGDVSVLPEYAVSSESVTR